MGKRKKDVLIEIKGTYRLEDDTDSIELLTTGSFYKQNNIYYISYEESEATGFEGAHTVLKVEEGRRVTMRRTGSAQSQLIVERGVRHQCHYDTGSGGMTIGISGDRVFSELNDSGGRLEFDYSLDVNTLLASENSVKISVRPQTPPRV